jgi:uncharacterized protein with von Willebrand factor type A (vWA) domain
MSDALYRSDAVAAVVFGLSPIDANGVTMTDLTKLAVENKPTYMHKPTHLNQWLLHIQ